MQQASYSGSALLEKHSRMAGMPHSVYMSVLLQLVAREHVHPKPADWPAPPTMLLWAAPRA
eukprot:365531-Chlamydomonas_euryale.AAC.3